MSWRRAVRSPVCGLTSTGVDVMKPDCGTNDRWHDLIGSACAYNDTGYFVLMKKREFEREVLGIVGSTLIGSKMM